jgi:hypothetical protein
MDYEERKRNVIGCLEGLKDDLLSIENIELIKDYEKEIFNKSLELEDILSMKH